MWSPPPILESVLLRSRIRHSTHALTSLLSAALPPCPVEPGLPQGLGSCVRFHTTPVPLGLERRFMATSGHFPLPLEAPGFNSFSQ